MTVDILLIVKSEEAKVFFESVFVCVGGEGGVWPYFLHFAFFFSINNLISVEEKNIRFFCK